jgi:hypothetical protein
VEDGEVISWGYGHALSGSASLAHGCTPLRSLRCSSLNIAGVVALYYAAFISMVFVNKDLVSVRRLSFSSCHLVSMRRHHWRWHFCPA